MDVGFMIRWPKAGTVSKFPVVGEELYATSLCRELLQIKGVRSAQVYAPNCMPTFKIDVMIHLNESLPGPFAKKHILYMQNFYPQGSAKVLTILRQAGYDGYAFFSKKLLEFHEQEGFSGIFLPLAADTTIFKPMPSNPKYEFDVVYVGNDIKGEERTMRYIYPAINFKFGLFGAWHAPCLRANRAYAKVFEKISLGNITREESAVLYSSAKIALNCTGQDAVDWDAMNLRFFEVLACKGFLISDRVPSAERELKDCVVFTDGGEDLITKIEYYLARPKERKEIAENGYRYVIANATVQARAKQLYNYILSVIG